MLLRLFKISMVLIALVIAALFIATLPMGTADSNAERRAKEFCATVNAGDDVDSVAKKASTAGGDLRAHGHPNEWFTVVFMGGSPFSVYACVVTVASNKVVSANYTYMD